MRSPPSFLLTLTLIPTLLTSAFAFNFTAPDSRNKLNVTETIRISWSPQGGSLDEPRAVSFDLWFNAHAGKNGNDRASWEIKSNLSLAEEHNYYDWNPSEDMRSIVDNDSTLSSDKVHTFSARLRDGDGKKLATVESEEFAIEGFESFTESSEALAQQEQPRAFVVGGAVVVGMMILGGL